MRVRAPEDLGPDAVRAVAAGASIDLDPALLAQIADRRRTALRMLAEGPDVYGVTTGMGAMSGVRLTEAEQADHSHRLIRGRSVGQPPYLDPTETRAMIAVRLRTFLLGDAAVSAELCQWLAALLSGPGPLPEVPRTGSGAAGEILPLAHAWQQPPELGPKEGLALLAGVPVATSLAILRGQELETLIRQSIFVAAGSVLVTRASRDPFEPAVARGDADLAEIVARIGWYAGSNSAIRGTAAAPLHLQAPVSFRVIGPVLAHLQRTTHGLAEAADRALIGVTDSPALLEGPDGLAFIGTAGFHGLDLAAAFESARAATVHAASVGTARLHRMLDPRFTGLAAQLSAAPGPMAGLAPLHKWAVARVHDLAGGQPSYLHTVETSLGQEDVQTFALEAAERLRCAIEVAREVLACEILAVHLASVLAPERLAMDLAPGSAGLRTCLAQVSQVLPAGAEDRPWAVDVRRLVKMLSSGWGGDVFAH